MKKWKPTEDEKEYLKLIRERRRQTQEALNRRSLSDSDKGRELQPGIEARLAPRRVPIPNYWDWMAIGEWHKAFGYEEEFGDNSENRLREVIRLNWHQPFHYHEVQWDVVSDIINNTARFRAAKRKALTKEERETAELLSQIEDL